MCMKDKCHKRIHGGSNGTDWNAEWENEIRNVWRDQCPGEQVVINFAQKLLIDFADDIGCDD